MALTLRDNGRGGVGYVLGQLEPLLPGAFTLSDPADGSFLRVERRDGRWLRVLSTGDPADDRTFPGGDPDLGLLWANRPGVGGRRWSPPEVIIPEAPGSLQAAAEELLARNAEAWAGELAAAEREYRARCAAARRQAGADAIGGPGGRQDRGEG
jgi:hypothetical protein